MIKTSQYYSSINIIGSGCIAHLLALKLLNGGDYFHGNLRVYSRTPKVEQSVEYQSNQYSFSQTLNYHTLKNWQPADLIIICVKSPQLPTLCRQMLNLKDSALTKGNTAVLLMMNGMGNLEVLLSHFPNLTLLQGITTHGAKFEVDTLIHSGAGVTKIGGLPSKHLKTHANEICKLLQKDLPEAEVSDDIFKELWKKLFINAVINPLTTLYKINNGGLITDLEINSIVRDLCNELTPLQLKLGISEKAFSIFNAVTSVAKVTANNISSMAQDHQKGQISEIDSITGYLLKKAENLQIELPRHREIYTRIKTLENHF